MKRYEILVHLGGGLITCLRILFASLENDLVQFHEEWVAAFEDGCRQVGELQTVLSRGGFIKDFS